MKGVETYFAINNEPPAQALEWVRDLMGAGSRIAQVSRLTGGTWHVNHAVDIYDRRGNLHQIVLRRWARASWALADPDFTAAREAKVLTFLARSAVPAPRLVAVDPEGSACDVPALVITRLPGVPPGTPKDLRSFLAQLAATLVVIHSVNGRARELVPGYRRFFAPSALEIPDCLPRSKLWERAFALARQPAPEGRVCFIHRDYHAGNTLWLGGRLTGVVDWTQASWGSASVDVGHMRWNLAAEWGLEAAEQFLADYQSLAQTGFKHDPYWDVATAVDLVADPEPEDPLPSSKMAHLEAHVAAALEHRRSGSRAL